MRTTLQRVVIGCSLALLSFGTLGLTGCGGPGDTPTGGEVQETPPTPEYIEGEKQIGQES